VATLEAAISASTLDLRNALSAAMVAA